MLTPDGTVGVYLDPVTGRVLGELRDDRRLMEVVKRLHSLAIAGRWAKLVRVSFAGELGWEIHTKVADTATVFDALWAAGQKHALTIARQHRGFGAGEVVAGQFGDGVEQPRAQRVVEEFGCDLRGRFLQTGHEFGAQGGLVLVVELDEGGCGGLDGHGRFREGSL